MKSKVVIYFKSQLQGEKKPEPTKDDVRKRKDHQRVGRRNVCMLLYNHNQYLFLYIFKDKYYVALIKSLLI